MKGLSQSVTDLSREPKNLSPDSRKLLNDIVADILPAEQNYLNNSKNKDSKTILFKPTITSPLKPPWNNQTNVKSPRTTTTRAISDSNSPTRPYYSQ